MKLTTIGIDLAKNVFQVHGADEKANPAMITITTKDGTEIY
jgi:hypothetical protein